MHNAQNHVKLKKEVSKITMYNVINFLKTQDILCRLVHKSELRGIKAQT